MTYVKLLGCWPLLGVFQQALGDHILQDGGEGIALGQLRSRLEDNLLQEIEDTLWTSGLVVFCAPREWELANSQLHDGQSNTPDVWLDGVRRTLDTLWGHVCACSYEGLGDGPVQLTGDTEIAELDLALGVDQDVGGLQIAVHDAMGAVEVAETAENGFRDLSEDIDAYGAELARHPV
jgi:hypothetical protein